MGRKVILYIASSLDGYIARSDGAVDWLSGIGGKEAEESYADFYGRVDNLIMGRTTYEQINEELSPDSWPYDGKKCYVVSRNKRGANENAEFISGDIEELVEKLKLEDGKGIWLVGGGQLVDYFIKHDLIDEYILTIIPTTLGDGIPLFKKGIPEKELGLVGAKDICGMAELKYVKLQSL